MGFAPPGGLGDPGRFVAFDWNATNRPSLLTEGLPVKLLSAGFPLLSSDTMELAGIQGAALRQVSNSTTGNRFAGGLPTTSIALNATKRPSALRAGLPIVISLRAT